MAAETDVGDNEVRHALPSDNSPVRRHFDDRTGIECGEADIARSSDCQAVKARLFASAADERSAIGSRPRPLSHLAQRDDVPRPQTPRYCLGDIEFLAVGRQSYAVWRDHSADHFALVAGGACFTGDAVLGEGSVFISPYRGAMAGYLFALTRLRMRDDFNVLCPGHGPPVWDAHTKLEEYLAHRIDRENNLIMALGEGRRTIQELLDAVWPEVPEQLLPLATATLAAHLDKLEDEQVLPAGVERPKFERTEW